MSAIEFAEKIITEGMTITLRDDLPLLKEIALKIGNIFLDKFLL